MVEQQQVASTQSQYQQAVVRHYSTLTLTNDTAALHYPTLHLTN